ncbi:serine/threonine-protein kinase [Antrihabitans stalactiti]|uniref:Serine/threonine-protein kinase PknK n=1 Tax=Antrihabitans stalactiti TaxID=2584121 RepID=A0A848KJJ8_9NOCA|nr:serine/threonine-protein kinase [Antrihabitans stalactiti]NMN98291.1 hypothetical protein [Antrihabitans stalactiti]
MAESELLRTQRRRAVDIATELNLDGFENAEEVGRGGYGVVFRCDQPELDRIVAVKVLTADLDAESLQRFIREQRAMGRLSGHPHIVPVFQVGTTNRGHPYLVMPYHARGSLESQIRDSGPLGWRETLRLGVKLAGALEAAHRAGTVHRDVKPGNVLLTDYGEPQLTDFGIARIVGGFETGPDVLTGSPGFTAPEVVDGAAPTVASDVYGLGATLFCALSGHAAFERRSGERVVAHFMRVAAHPVPDLRAAGLPASVCALIERAMSVQPADRPETAAAFGRELAAAQRDSGVPVDEMALPTESDSQLGALGPSPTATPQRRTTAPPTPTTKYQPPTRTRSLVARTRLLDLLRAERFKRLTLMHAPSGFGKTTLAAQWRDELTSGGVEVVWLTVDEDDSNLVWFLEHLIEAIRNLRPELADELEQVLDAEPDDPARYVLTALINDLHARDDRIVIVLDDWHYVRDESTRAALRYLLDHGCHHLPIVVTSTTNSGLSLSRLRISADIIDIDADAMRFDRSEARALLVDIGGLGLSDSSVAALNDATDGWVAGLQLATLSLRAGEDPAQLVDRVSGHADVGEFLAENVIDTLEPNLLEFLLATSITPRICAELAAELADVDRGQALLDEIESRGLFLHKIDGSREWFRYHALFADYLRRRLERDRPELVEGLHYRASAWFAAHHQLNEAVDHALAAGNPDRAVDLVEQDEAYLLERSQLTALHAVLAKLPARLIASRPRIQLLLAWVNVLLQRPAPMHAALNRFVIALDKAVLTDAEHADLRAEGNVVEAVAEAFADRSDRLDELLHDALERPNSFTPRVAGAAGNIASFAAFARFDFESARRWPAWATPYNELMGPFATIYSHCFAGLAAREQLDLPAAVYAYREALDLSVATVGPHSHAARLAAGVLAEVLYWKGELAEASVLAEESYELGSEGGGGVDFMIARYATGARVKAAQGDRDTAAKRLADGMAVARRLDLPRLYARLLNELIALGFEVPARDEERLRGSRTLVHDNGIDTIVAETDEDSAIRLLLASREPDRLRQACDRARTLADGIDSSRRPLAALRARLLLAAALSAADRSGEAESELAPAAALCAELGLTRLLFDATAGSRG